MHNKCGFSGLIQLLAFGAAVIGKKDKPVVFYIFEQDNPRIRHAVTVNGGQGNGIRIIELSLLRLGQPSPHNVKRGVPESLVAPAAIAYTQSTAAANAWL
jgi:hypothetical protein